MSIVPDILNDPCTSLDGWATSVDPEQGTITISDGIRLYCNDNPDGDPSGSAGIVKYFSSLSSFPATFTVEMTVYLPALLPVYAGNPYPVYAIIGGKIAGTENYNVLFFVLSSTGLYLCSDASEPILIIPTVKCNETAEAQIFRFEVDSIAQTVSVYVDNVSKGTHEYYIVNEPVDPPVCGIINYNSYVFDPGNPVYQDQDAYIKSIKIGTGLGSFDDDLSVFVSDAIGITDTQDVFNSMAVEAVDSFGLMEGFDLSWYNGTNYIYDTEVSEQISAVDQQSQAYELYGGITDTIAFADSQGIGWLHTVDETVDLSESHAIEWRKTITEVIFAWEEIINGWYITNTESLELTDTQSVVLGLMISDWLTLVDSQTNNWNGRDIINDTLNLYDISEKYFMVSTSVNESLVVADTANYALTVTVLEYLGFTELASAMKSMSQSLNDSLAFSDSPDHAFQLFITEALSVVDVSSVIAAFFKTVQESLTMADTVSFINRLGLSLNEYLVLAETVTNQGTLYTSVTDTLAMNVIIELNGEVYECYVLNTPKFMASMYSGYNFNSYCVFENRAFGANDTGIYELTGTTDAGATIHTGAILSETDFGLPNQKKFRHGYLGISGTTPVMVFETEDGARQAYAVDTQGKVTASSELKSKKWKLSIADFDTLDAIKLLPIILTK